MTDGLSVDNQEVETMIKGKIDHKDLDVKFTIQRQKNDALLVDEIERLREAKKELRDFERNMD